MADPNINLSPKPITTPLVTTAPAAVPDGEASAIPPAAPETPADSVTISNDIFNEPPANELPVAAVDGNADGNAEADAPAAPQAAATKNEAIIDNLYATTFGRPADSEGRAYWTEQLNKGTDIETIRWSFVNSDEYQKGVQNGSFAKPGALGQANVDPTLISIEQIDNFGVKPDANGVPFDHGKTVSGFILKSSNPNMTQINPLDSQDGNLKVIGDSLEGILNKLDKGQDVDAVNMSMSFEQDTPDSQRIRELVDKITQRGVAVDISAGNKGAGVANFMGTENAFIIENTEGGLIDLASGPGNARAEGTTTSFAAGNFTGQIAQLINRGFTLDQARAEMTRRDQSTFDPRNSALEQLRLFQTVLPGISA